MYKHTYFVTVEFESENKTPKPWEVRNALYNSLINEDVEKFDKSVTSSEPEFII